ncbi:PREDICTED: collagen alpha-1(XVII) chain-like [Corvus brachyrhynchos]|uniref:collagen alpha-1(XVII) chain-like n=1 Tax=Corvus brachyrhynchos TaxID=85066 RepID=UPI0008166E69|nr:PREDICTED: collagen alpha-1(XVII) chain-like [Corvus brachyrhynchos]
MRICLWSGEKQLSLPGMSGNVPRDVALRRSFGPPGISWGSGRGSVGTPTWSLLYFQVPAAGEGEAGALLEQELGSVDSRELRGIAGKGNYEAMVPLSEDHSDHVRGIVIPGLTQLPSPSHVECGGIPGPEDAGSKPALLPPAEDREDPGTPGLPEKGAVPGQLGDSETIVIKMEEQQAQEDGAELLALPMAPTVRLDEELPLSQEQPGSWEGHGKVHAVAASPAGSLPGHEPELEPCKALSQDDR